MTDQSSNPLVTEDDPWDDAEKAQAPTLVRTNFGELFVDIWQCVLTPGIGKELFDLTVHDIAKKQTAIEISLTPLASSPYHDVIKRDFIAKSKEWASICRPSIEALKVDPRTLNGRFAQADMVLTGKKWTNKAGEVKDLTTFKFVKFFASVEECEAAAAAFFGRSSQPSSTAGPSASTNGNGAAVHTGALSGNAPDPQRDVAAKFLPNLWKGCGGDVDAFASKLAGNARTAKYFDLSSPEVIAVVTGGAK